MADPSADPDDLEGVDDELIFTDLLISSLDPHSDTYALQLAELQAKLARLNHLKAMYEQRQQLAGSFWDQQPAADASSNPSRDNWWQAAMNGRPNSNHSSSDDSGTFTPGSAYDTPMNHTKRARPQSSYLDPVGQHPTKRHTPEPSRVGTPGSSDATHNFMDELAQRRERARLRQQAAEAAARRQYETQQADLALARELAQQGYAPSSFASSSTARPPVQTTLNYNGSYQRPPPPRPEPSSSRLTSETQNPSYPSLPSQPVKSEPGFSPQQQRLPQRSRQAPQFVDLTGNDSDEDVEEIAQNGFKSNQRQPATSSHRTFAPNPQFAPVPTTMQMPGSYPGMNINGTRNVYGNNGMSSSGASWLNGLTNGITNGLAGPLRQLNEFVSGSSSARPWSLDDDDDDDVIFGGYRQASGMPSYGNYAGNEALYRERYDAFAAHDSTKTREEIQAMLENIRPDEDLPAHLRVQTPESLSVKLHKYQELGLTWLKKCEEGSNKGGILADDMGLGKTIQMLALMVERKSTDPRRKTTLIVAPLALMRQWAQEIKSKLKDGRHRLSVFTHHGTHKAKTFHDLRSYDVVLTTYGSIASELKKLERFELRKKQDPTARPYQAERLIFLDDDAHFYRVVLDEAQCIKNRNTQAHKGACRINADYRFCVTGTPMMNNVEEFYSLVHFLRIRPFCRWEKFRLDINGPLKSGSDQAKERAMQTLQTLCRAVMLRRTKQSKFEGEPILVLPDRTTEVDYPVFDEDEQTFYKALESRSQLDFNKYLKRGTVGKSYSAILVLLLRLRQACCHPHLIRDFGVAAAADLQEEQMLDFAKQLSEPVVARIKETNGNFECPVCYDVTANPAIFIPCGHDTCSECFSRIADPANALQNGEEGGAGIRCPNCRGAIDPKRLTDFQSFKKVHMPELLTAEERGENEATAVEEADEDDDESGSDSDSEAEEEDDGEDLKDFVVPDDFEESADEAENDAGETSTGQRVKTESIKEEDGVAGPSSATDLGIAQGAKTKEKGKGKEKKQKKSKKSKGKRKEKVKKPKGAVTLAELKKLATRNQKAKKAYLHRLRKDFVSSAKLDKTMELLRGIMDSQEGEKVLIFSQWTSLLDLLEVPIDEAGFGYRRYDGSMSASMRGDAVDDFRDESKNVRIMLISLKAGNAGLNLNMANQVIILDPFWNPYIEEQAIDRAHRFGQMRPVKVHRLLIQETVEDRIIALQEKKRALIQEALDENKASALARLGVQELAYLFGVTHDPSQRIDYTERSRR